MGLGPSKSRLQRDAIKHELMAETADLNATRTLATAKKAANRGASQSTLRTHASQVAAHRRLGRMSATAAMSSRSALCLKEEADATKHAVKSIEAAARAQKSAAKLIKPGKVKAAYETMKAAAESTNEVQNQLEQIHSGADIGGASGETVDEIMREIEEDESGEEIDDLEARYKKLVTN